MKTFKYIMISLFCLLPAVQVFGQINVKGTVLDKNGLPVPGAVVMIVGTSTGVSIEDDGTFIMEDVSEDAVIEASCLGYIPAKQKVSAVMNFVLTEDVNLLDELVVVGYGVTKKSDVTGAVSSVKADELPRAASASIGEMMRGRAAGMSITSNSASPGGALSISIRGGLSGAAPLIVVDGVPQASSSSISSGTVYQGSQKDGGLININPNDIESIDILKDASSASIYGSDASGGVILITTKRGQDGKVNISYSGSVAVSYITDAPHFMNAKDFMITQNQIFDEFGRGAEKKYSQEFIDSFVGDGTDWLKEVTRLGVVNEHNVTATAGNDNTQVLMSASYYDQQGIAKNSAMNRITGRINVDQKIGKKVTFGINSSYSRIKYNDVPLGEGRQEKSALIYSAMTFIPISQKYNEDGTYASHPQRELYPNPLSLLDIVDNTVSNNLNISGYLEYRPIEGLSVRATAGVDQKDVQADQYIPTTTRLGASMGGQASKQNAKNMMQLLNIVANYNKKFKGIHDFSAMLGWEYKEASSEGMGVVASQFPFDNALYNNLGASAQEKPTISSYKTTNEMASFIGRVNYTLMDRYIITANVRVDGSSNFSPTHQWGVFPGISLGWKLKEENWLKDVRWLSELKLRGGIGQTGNAGTLTGIYSYYSIRNDAYTPGGSIVNGVYKAKLGNDNLKWETLTDINIGLDAAFFNDRLQIYVDAYQRLRTDVILSKKLLSYNEVTSIDYNSGDVYRSRGIDVSIHSVNISKEKFTWTTDLNFSYYRNKTVARDPDWNPAIYQTVQEDWGNVYGYKFDGLVQQGESYPYMPKAVPGCIKFLDINGYVTDQEGNKVRNEEGFYMYTGKPDGILDEADIVLMGNNTPIPFSINNTFQWGNFDLNIYIYGSLNGFKQNNVRYMSVWGVENATYGLNVVDELKDRWTVDNPNAKNPGVYDSMSGNGVSTFYYEKAWYLRLDNISLGYSIPSKVFNDKIRQFRVYAAARNIAVITPYTGMDPETGGSFAAYPNSASVAIGLQLQF